MEQPGEQICRCSGTVFHLVPIPCFDERTDLMPRIFDNIDLPMLPTLRDTLHLSQRADFCVGYFNLRGWRRIDSLIEAWPGGEGACCRLLVGMQQLPQDELRSAFSLGREDEGIDQQTALRLKKRMAEEFKLQLTLGAPTDQDEAGLRRLSARDGDLKLCGVTKPVRASFEIARMHRIIDILDTREEALAAFAGEQTQ